MKSSVLMSFGLALALGWSVAAGAQTTASTPANAPWTEQVAPHPGSQHARDARGNRSTKLADSHCLRETGSLIRRKPGHCLSGPGQSYSREDIMRTGQTNTAQALQMLDPNITAHGH